MSIQIELASAQHTPEILAIYAPFIENTPTSFETEVPTLDEMTQRIQSTCEKFPWLVCMSDGQLLGYAYASQHRTRAAYQWSVDVSVYTHVDARRMGIGRVLYTALLPLLQAQGFFNAFAGIALPNPASVGFHESFGFLPIGVYKQVGYKLGAWHDVGWWQLSIQPVIDNPAPPCALAKIYDTPTWHAALSAGLAQLRTP
jgi:L-amino acid N-acyltransferase YncA